MGASAASGLHMLAMRTSIPICKQNFWPTSAVSVHGRALSTRTGFASCAKTTLAHPLFSPVHKKFAVRAMSESGAHGLPIDLSGKKAFIAGVADDNGYGWAIAKALAAAGAEILVGT